MTPVTREISYNLPCTTCGYNLRGLSPDGRCPECGHEIQLTLIAMEERARRRRISLPPPIEEGDPRWRRHAWLGILILCISTLCGVGTLTSGRWANLGVKQQRRVPVTLAATFWTLSLWGIWKLSAVDRLAEDDPWHRYAMRAGVASHGILLLLMDSDSAIVRDLDVLLIMVFGLAGLPLTTLTYYHALDRLALRLRNEPIALLCRGLKWIMPPLVVISLLPGSGHRGDRVQQLLVPNPIGPIASLNSLPGLSSFFGCLALPAVPAACLALAMPWVLLVAWHGYTPRPTKTKRVEPT